MAARARGERGRVGDREDRCAALRCTLGDIDQFLWIVPEGHNDEQVPCAHRFRRAVRESAARLQHHDPDAEHGQDVSKEFDHRGRAELTGEEKRIRQIHEPGRAIKIGLRHLGEQVLKGRYVARDQFPETALMAGLFRTEFPFQRFDPGFESRGGGGEAFVEDALKFLEALVPEALRETDEAGRMDAASVGNGVHGQHRHVVRMLGQKNRDALMGPAHAVETIMNEANEGLMIEGEGCSVFHGVDVAQPSAACNRNCQAGVICNG